MRTTQVTLSLLSIVAVWIAAPAIASADTYENITIEALDGATLDARVYLPDALDDGAPAVIMMHGCGGMWSNDVPASGGVNEIERWGVELAAQGYVAIAVDGYGGRTPENVSWVSFQSQCSGTTYAGAVNPYTTRVDDIAAAHDFLDAEYEVGEVGLLGWSQGAQSVMVAIAATPRDDDDPYADAPDYAAAIAYYPGCGGALGYGLTSTKDGYWRPAAPMRLHHGTADSLYGSCDRRADNAIANLGAGPGSADELHWIEYPGVGHSFDNTGGRAFPTSTCSASELADAALAKSCAQRDADLDSLSFLLAEATAP